MATYVLDQNFMRRNDSLADRVQAEPDAMFVVPDTAFVEMVKSERWEDTMRRSFSALRPAAERTFISISIGEALRLEFATKRPIDRISLLPNEFRDFARDIIPALVDADREAATRTDFRDRVNAFRLELLAKEANPDSTKVRLEKLVGLMSSACGPKIVADLRSGRMDTNTRLGFIQRKGDEIFLQTLAMEATASLVFRSARPLLLRYIYLLFRHVLRWVELSGLQNAKPTIVLNHMLDQEYVLVGSFFDAVLTNDREGAMADEELRILLDDASRDELQRCVAEYAQDQ